MSERCTECGGGRPGTGLSPACECAPGSGNGTEGGHRERVRMARDLHDLVGSTLSAITVTSAAAQTSTSTSAARQEL
ncbi:hypothetical protein CLM83_28045, partial [Streptomyces albidoflavus]